MHEPNFSDPKAQPVTPNSAWIDPQGGFHPVPDCGHENWAQSHYGVWGSTLEDRGWLHLSFGGVMKAKPPTQRQIDTLFDVFNVYTETAYSYLSRFRATFEYLMSEVNV